MELKAITVSALLAYVRELFTQDVLLRNVTVSGEISSYRPHNSGHMYFVLKDANAQIKCVMFKSRNTRLNFTPENGMHVAIRGYFSLYERDGQMQLYVEDMQEEGIGSLHAAFEKLKEDLRLEGLFDNEYKKHLPFLPRRIGVITSSSGAVINDIRTVLARRMPVEIVLAPAVVQGGEASKSIVFALEKLHKVPGIEVIIIARGGGSIEDLWPFNTVEVARAVFASQIPVVSAVGHETDFTICDFVADVRAATPSEAAELVVPVFAELKNTVIHTGLRLNGALRKIVEYKGQALQSLADRPVLKQPVRLLDGKRQYLDSLQGKLILNLSLTYERKNAILKEKAARIHALSPIGVLARGYVLCYDQNGELLKSVKHTKLHDNLTVKTSDGRLACTVQDIWEEASES